VSPFNAIRGMYVDCLAADPPRLAAPVCDMVQVSADLYGLGGISIKARAVQVRDICVLRQVIARLLAISRAGHGLGL